MTNPTSAIGGGGVATPSADDTVFAVVGSERFHRWGVMDAGGLWTDIAVLSEREDVASVSRLAPGLSTVDLIARIPRFEADHDGWRTYSEVLIAEISGRRSVEADWTPEPLVDMTAVVIGTNDAGEEVRIGTDFRRGAIIRAEGWFRAAGGDEWSLAEGFSDDGALSLAGVAHVAESWAVYGGARESAAPGEVEHAAIVLSPDGLAWHPQSGDFGSGRLASTTTGVCELPSGDLLAVGWEQTADGSSRAIAWIPDSAGWWSRIDIGSVGAVAGFAMGCASDGDGVVIAASSEGRSILARTIDGSDWVETFRAGRGDDVGVPVKVAGGFAAPGTYATAASNGPAVWLSRDGVTWTPTRVPSRAPGSTIVVAPAGEGLVVAQSGRIGAPLLRVPDIARVIGDVTSR